MHPGSTLSFELAAQVVSVARTRPARAFRRKQKNGMYIRHRDETYGWHVCAGRAKHVVDLDPTVARTGPHDGGAGRAAYPPGAPETEEHPPE